MDTTLPAPLNGLPRPNQAVAAHKTPFKWHLLRTWLIALFPLLQPLPASADILVGIASPKDGPGAEIRRAAKVAAERINTEGGVYGKRIKLFETDDGCNGEQGSLAAHSLIERDVAVVIGHPCASAASASVKVYVSNNVVLLSMTRYPVLTEKRAGPTIFRVPGRNDRQGASAAAYLSRNFAGRPIAVVRDASRFACRVINDAHAALKEAGFTDVLSAAIRGGQKDYSKLIAQLQAANTEALFFAGFPLEAGLLLRQMREAGLSTAFIGSDTLAPAQFADTAGSAATGARILLSHDPARGAAGTSLKVKPDERPPTGLFLTTLAAIEAWRAAVRKAGSIAPDAVSAALQEGTFETVLGHISFAENGDSNVPAYDVVTWNMNAWRSID